MFIGTSAGAINATIFAAFAHLSPLEQAEAALDIWRGISISDVFRSPVAGFPSLAVRYCGQLLRRQGVAVDGLLDTTPLRRTAHTVLDVKQLRRNVSGGLTRLAVVATSGADNRTVVFVDSADEDVPPPDDDRPICYVATEIGADHVLASSAIPIVFPPVHVSAPAAGWYLDGGIRLNAPLKPALTLGADAIAVVATHPVSEPAAPASADHPAPDIDDVLVRLMDAALVDRMVEDVRTLAKINALAETGGPTRKVIPYLAICPAARETLAHLAVDIFDGTHNSPQGLGPRLRGAELKVLGHLLAGDGPRRGDLFSYLYFDRDFIDASIELGRSDALAQLGSAVPWRIGPQ